VLLISSFPHSPLFFLSVLCFGLNLIHEDDKINIVWRGIADDDDDDDDDAYDDDGSEMNEVMEAGNCLLAC